MGKVINCSCVSQFQDKEYGLGKRYHNSMIKNRTLLGFRCTVCGHKIDSTVEDKSAMKSDKKENN